MSVPSSFEFATATRIIFGAGCAREIPTHVAALGMERVLLVTGKQPARSAELRAAMAQAGLELDWLHITGEPSLERVREALTQVASAGSQVVVAIGGGSVIDAGKALAVLATNGGDPLDYLEVIGRGRTLLRPSLPFIAVPTTAGTGAEVTRNAVLSSERDGVKASLRSPLMLPRMAVVDPELLADAPSEVLRSSGLDALSQLIEPFLSSRHNPISDALAREGMQRSARSLRRAVADGAKDAGVREDLALASLFGGLCLANAGLGAVHGFAAPAGGMFHAPHGAVCAALLPHVLEVNLRALEAREPTHPARARIDQLGPLLTGDPAARSAEAIGWVHELSEELRVPGLGNYGMTASDVPALVAKAKLASSMQTNPIALTDAELTEIATRALGSAGL